MFETTTLAMLRISDPSRSNSMTSKRIDPVIEVRVSPSISKVFKIGELMIALEVVTFSNTEEEIFTESTEVS